MTIQIANNALESCNSLDQVVALINDESASDASSEIIAAAYAINSVEESGYDLNEDNLEAQLDALILSGAWFVYHKSMEQAIASKKD